MSKEQAFWNGLMSGVFECVFEKWSIGEYDIISNGDFSEYETKVRQYVINGMTETEAKKKAALEIGEQIAEDIVSELFKEIIGK